MRRLLLFLFVCCCTSFAFAQIEEGMLKGTVVLEDGTPCINTTVRVHVGVRNNQFSTDANGVFVVQVPIGEGTVEISGITVPVTITAGRESTVKVIIPQKIGILFTVTQPGPQNADVGLRVAYQSPQGEGTITAVETAGGHYWAPGVPEKVTRISAIFDISNGKSTSFFRQQWNIEKEEALRAFTVTLPAMGEPRIKLLDEEGELLIKEKVKCILARAIPMHFNNFWTPTFGNDISKLGQIPFTVMTTTDAEGMLILEPLPAQQYILTVQFGDISGLPVTFEVKDDGTVTINEYLIRSKGRRVIQTVFDTVGNPLKDHSVIATYCWGGKMIYRTAKSDAEGKVTWEELPPVRVIVFGSGVSACVIPIDALKITTPLPAPQADKAWYDMDLKVTYFGAPMDLHALVVGEGVRNEHTSTIERGSSGWQARVRGGTICDVLVLLDGEAPKLASYIGAYMPYLDGASLRVEFAPFTFQDIAVIHGRFVTPDEQPVPGVNRLDMLPYNASSEVENLLKRDGLPGWVRQPFSQQADGTFIMRALFSGKYRLFVDLYDETTPPLPALIIDTTKGQQEVVIHLPPPFAHMPAGTALSYLWRTQPAVPRQLIVHASADIMPVFAPAERLLACWGQPHANTLMLWSQTDAQWRSLPLRSIFWYPRNPANISNQSEFEIYPPLPVIPGQERSTLPYLGGMRFSTETRYNLNLFPFSYLFGQTEGNIPQISGTFDVPVDNNTEISLRMNHGIYWPTMGVTATSRLHMKLQQPLPELRANTAMVSYDLPYWERNQSMITDDMSFNIPRGAKNITIQWPGVGIIRKALLPTADVGVQQKTLPPFEAGSTFSGTVTFAEADVPNPGLMVLIISTNNQYFSSALTIPVADDGAFSAPNLPDGNNFFYLQVNRENIGAWSIEVPGEQEKLTLRVPVQPVILLLPINIPDTVSYWWCPQGGTPRRLPCSISTYKGNLNYQKITAFDLSPGAGELWGYDNNSQRMLYISATLQSGENQLTMKNIPVPSLGLFFPLDKTIGVPGAVKLIGLGARAGIEAEFANIHWQLISALNLVTAQLEAVPPGEYRVIVYTANGTRETTVKLDAWGGTVTIEP